MLLIRKTHACQKPHCWVASADCCQQRPAVGNEGDVQALDLPMRVLRHLTTRGAPAPAWCPKKMTFPIQDREIGRVLLRRPLQ